MKSKKIVSFILALALCVPVVTADIINNENLMISTYADTTEDGFEYVINTTQGYVAITGYSGSATDIVIPSEIEGYPVTTIGAKCFYYNEEIISITIPDSVTYIDKNAFDFCKSLSNVVIGNNVKTIGNKDFNGCTALTTITIPDSVTSIGTEAFAFCSTLMDIKLSNNLTVINASMFYNCSLLTEVTIPSSVEKVDSFAFAQCSALEKVIIKSENTEIHKNAFYNCPNVNIIYDYENEPSTTTTETLVIEPPTTTTDNNFKNGIYGDMNGDGVTNIIDLILMKKLILGL